MLMSAKALLMANPEPTEAEIRTALAGNLCRCTGYTAIVEAVQEASGPEATAAMMHARQAELLAAGRPTRRPWPRAGVVGRGPAARRPVRASRSRRRPREWWCP